MVNKFLEKLSLIKMKSRRSRKSEEFITTGEIKSVVKIIPQRKH